MDKNPYSKSFGCFDRKYWQYKIIDFPCGMMQELLYPLTYIWSREKDKNLYAQNEQIHLFIIGSLKFWRKQQHKDGSVDDYFPHERAYGATAYSLAALSEAYLLLDEGLPEVIESFEKSAYFLATYRESGLLSNHLAIASEALINVYQITKHEKWKKYSDELVTLLIEQQSEEGWYKEYQGCDLGYQTVTIEFLARRYKAQPDSKILVSLKKCIHFLTYFLHPDGSIGGEYGSRNTFNFYPGGFELLKDDISECHLFLNSYEYSLKNNSCNFLEDDGVFSHLLSSFVTVLTSNSKNNDKVELTLEPFKYFPDAGLFSIRHNNLQIFGNTTKGGVFKVFKNKNLICSDTGYVGTLNNGMTFCQNNPESSKAVKIDKNSISIEGSCSKLKARKLKRIEMAGLRILSILFGNISGYSNFIRILMQKVLIFGSKDAHVSFQRQFSLTGEKLKISDQLKITRSNLHFESLSHSSSLVNLHVVTSDSFQLTNLRPWATISDINGKTFYDNYQEFI